MISHLSVQSVIKTNMAHNIIRRIVRFIQLHIKYRCKDTSIFPIFMSSFVFLAKKR